VYKSGLLVAYDIACRFKITATNSSIGEAVKKAGVTWVVPAFHAWPHNRQCQTEHHPLYTQGVGLEDFETQERLYSFTNQCAGVTRHSSPFHREQVLHGQFQRNDCEKYATLGMFTQLHLYCSNAYHSSLPPQQPQTSCRYNFWKRRSTHRSRRAPWSL